MNTSFELFNRYGHKYKLEFIGGNEEKAGFRLHIPKECYFVRQGGEEGDRFVDFEGGPFLQQGHCLPFSFMDEAFKIVEFLHEEENSLIIKLEVK